MIPKREGADATGQFRPIALCNVIYKIISKVIANMLKTILHFMISLEKYRFVEGRQLLDGIILVHEVIQSLNITNKLGMLIKLDLAKAYDKISWKFMKEILRDFGFNELWVS